MLLSVTYVLLAIDCGLRITTVSDCAVKKAGMVYMGKIIKTGTKKN